MLPLRALLSQREPVRRGQYLAAGVGLALVKYSADAGAYFAATGELWHPVDYLDPTFAGRFQQAAGGAPPLPSWLLIFFVLWSLPFLWIGVAMSARRARDAGFSSWWGLVFLIPVLNYLCILGLVCLPSRPGPAIRPPPDKFTERFVIFAVGIVILLGAAMIGILTEGFAYYGTGLFLGLPFLLGTVTGYLYNLTGKQSVTATLGLVALTLAMGFLGLLLFALEGLVCLFMAYPIMLAAALPGALFGRALARLSTSPDASLGALILLLPLGVVCEGELSHPPLRKVVTSIEIDAPPRVVWDFVVAFSELSPPEHWLFATGIAYPLRASIDGMGVGAVRRCEFSTGAFVEPITTWDEPRLLAFDVSAQPLPMEEWSFYAQLTPPHLTQSFQSRRGEFRLTPLPSGGTLLEGSTWYTMEMGPAPYWQLWSDAILHQIHLRVLRHIRGRAELSAALQ